MVEHYAFLFLGEDEIEKRKKINSIKVQYLDKGLKDIDFEIVYSDNKELSPHIFNEILSYLPSSDSKKRIVYIKKIDSLNQENKEVLIKYLKSPSKSVLLLLDSDKLNVEDAFVKKLEPFVKKINFKREEKLKVFDLTDAIAQRNIVDALKILNTLIKNREKPESILGTIRWKWEEMKDRLSLEKFKQGLKFLLDTDIRIKTGRIEEELALQLVIVRLSYLA